MKAGAVVFGAAIGPAQAGELFFKCQFDWVCDPNRSCGDAALDLRFAVDEETQAARRVGGSDTSVFSVILGDRAVTLLEVPISGGVSVTTVTTRDGAAVHSENALQGTTLEPRQYIGFCTNP